MKTLRASLCLSTAIVVLAGCGGSEPAIEGEGAKGDVLEGSISDEMVPLDTVRSQPPLAERAEIEDGQEDAADDEAGGDAEPPED